MRGSFILAALITATVSAPAHAQVEQVPRPYAIPMPPITGPMFEVGVRYWASEGKTRFDINSSKKAPFYGNPTSTLTYDGMEGHTAEFVWRARNEVNTFAKGFVGGGWLNGGSLDDEDFFAGQVKFMDTYSKLKGNDMIYGTIDVGQTFILLDRASRVTIGPFIGFNFWQEETEGYGLRCNRDDVGGFYCGAPGSMLDPFSTRVFTNQANWASLRLGGELRVKLWDRLSLSADAAVLPIAYLWNNDSHHLRTNLGRVPNIEDKGTGWGYQLEAAARFDVTPSWAVGAGVRYWYAETNGESDFIHVDLTSELDDFTSERFGVYGDISYRF